MPQRSLLHDTLVVGLGADRREAQAGGFDPRPEMRRSEQFDVMPALRQGRADRDEGVHVAGAAEVDRQTTERG